MCGAELSRLRHRRSLRNMALACFVVLVLGVIGVSFQYHSMAASDVFQVKTKAASVEAAETAAYQECVASKPVIPLYVACGLPIRDRDYEFTQYMTDKPFTLELAMPQYARILGLFFAMMAFVIGAVWIGVEWVSGSLAMSVLWTPDRLKVMTAKIAALVIGVGTCAVGLQALWIAATFGLATFRGPRGYFVADWGGTLLLDAKLVLIAALAALAGFAVANLTRNAVGSIGLIVGYALGVEGAVRALSPTSQKWLLSNSLDALLKPGGVILKWGDGIDARYMHVSQTPALLSALVVVAIVVGSVAWFRKADLA
jgi:hypothetical protein